MVIDWYKQGEANLEAAERPTETIRNYHEPRNEVLDKTSGLKQPYKKVVIGGDIADMIDARRKTFGEE